MSELWFVMVDGEQCGPFTIDQLKRYYAAGRIGKRPMVRLVNQKQFREASDELTNSLIAGNVRSFMIRAALLGAILVHPLLILGFVICGALFGAVDCWNANRAAVFGVEGLQTAFGNLLTIYLISCGLFPLGVSVVGAGLGVAVRAVTRKLRSAQTRAIRENSNEPR